MSLVDNYNVHLGFWTNWSHGKLEGATLTLTRRNGEFLVAFIAIFVGAAGKSFWRIICFLLHRMLSSPRPRDGIYHQLQAVLRNSDTAQDAAWELGQIIWAWRLRPRFRRPFPRLIGIIVLAMIISISFGVAGVFSSQITSDTANEVLLTGANCGMMDSNDENYEAYANLFMPRQAQRATAFSNYVQRCYGANSSAVEDCYPYIQRRLQTTLQTNASCPFDNKICKSQTENLIVDSGLIDSHKHLGLNSQKEHRFQMRLVHHCAPLATKGYSAHVTPNDTNEEVVRYYYGPIDERADFTQEMPTLENVYNLKLEQSRPFRTHPRRDYTINVLKTYGGPPEKMEPFNMFSPIDEIKKEDADMMLFFLSSPGITFNEPVDDPWFSAHKQGVLVQNTVTGANRSSYIQDEPVGVLGCTMQVQYCNPNLPEDTRCSPLAGYADDRFNVTELYDSKSQKQTIEFAKHTYQLGFMSLSAIVDSLGVSALMARQGLAADDQGPLPSNQWQLEVAHWISASLASIQSSFVEMGVGPGPIYQQFRVPPENTDEWRVCKNQKIMTTRYSSFSVIGLGLIFCIGGLIMILDLLLEPIVDWYQTRASKRAHPQTKKSLATTYARLEWSANTTLQLQRLAHEHIGVGTWKYGDLSHPVTLPGEKLAMVDTSNESHILFKRPEDWEDPSSITSTIETSTIDEEKGTPKTADTGSDTSSVRAIKATDVPRTPKQLRTWESFDSFAAGKRKVTRMDTTTTLVGENDDNAGGEKSTFFLEEDGVIAESPIEERPRRRQSVDDEILPSPRR